jgi:hypothetical protein
MLETEYVYFQALSCQVRVTVTLKLTVFGFKSYLSVPIVSEITRNPSLHYIS